MNGIKTRGAGHAVPRSIVTNDDLTRRMDTSDEWIVTRTGIRRRHHCTDETQTSLCIAAAKAAMDRSGAAPEDIGVCLVATMSPERMMPSTACMVQGALGLPTDTLCFDMNAACSGFMFALHTAECQLAASGRKMGLVIGGEALSRMVNWADRGNCILFGDGAGAVVVESRRAWPSIGAVAACGGMGTISAALSGLHEPDFDTDPHGATLRALDRQVRRARETAQGAGLVAVNVMVATARYADCVRAAIRAGADAVVCGAGLPVDLPSIAAEVPGNDAALAPIVSSGRAAALICRAWQKRSGRLPDFVVLEGPLAGGHLGFTPEEAGEAQAGRRGR